MNNNQNDQQRINLNEFVPDPSKRNELKRRLYDSGISNVPMPSVKREIEENISAKPYQAKMNTNKIQSVSNVKNKIEGITKKIYSNLQDSYKEAAAIEAKYKGEGTAEYYKNQHVNVPPSQVLQGSLRASQKLVPQLEHDEEGHPHITGMATTNRILLNKCKPNQLPSLSDYGRQRMNEAGEVLDPNMRFLQGPPTTMLTGFEGGHSMNQKNLELARSKFLLDKLTNKLPPELRQGMGQKLPPMMQDSARESATGKDKSNVPVSADGNTFGHADEKQNREVVTQKWTDLDKFIELLLDSKSEEETVFVYLNPNKETGDPYQLEILNDFQARDRTRYYTLSGKGLTLYVKDTPVEFISLGQWLIERDSYNCIKEFKFFKQFKKWKFMRMWKKTIKREARVKATNQLETKLFILQNIFSDHLMKHRKLMLDMANRKFIDECEGSGETKKLEEFAQAQVNKTEQVSEEIKRFSQKSRDNIKECIGDVLTDLRSRILSEITLDEQRRQQQPAGNTNQGAAIKRKETKDSSDTLGFPEGMTFGHRSRLRAACSRFLRFAFLVDFLALESLANIYTGSVDAMIKRLERLDGSCDMKAIIDADQQDSNATTAPRGLEPLFYVEVKLDEKPIDPKEEGTRVIEEFILPPRGTAQVQDFDPIAHLVLDDPNEEEPEPGEEDDKPPEPIIQRTVPNIDKLWLTMSPSKEDYVNVILRTFQSGLDKIKQFERWSKHSQLMPYRNVLEDWDDIVGEPGWDMLDSVNLDPKLWIVDNPLYSKKRQFVNNILDASYNKLEMFLQRFQPILELYWRNKQADLQKLVDENLRNPQDSLINVIELFLYQKEFFSARLPPQADIGLIQLDSKKSRTVIQPTPQKYIEQLNVFIPQVIKQRNEVAKKWLKENLEQLDYEPDDLEAFVEQQAAYLYVSDNFQEIRDKVGLYGEFYNILEEKGLKVHRADTESHTESLTEINKVQNAVQKIESNQEKDKERFKKDMNVRIPALDKEINEVFDKSKDKKYLDGDNMEKMFEIINELDAIENHFKSLEETAIKYNDQQVVLEMQPTVFENLDDARTEISLRAQMWRSLRQWGEMNEEWVATRFADIDPAAIAKEADKYFSIAMRIEKNLDPNPIQETLKKQVVTFKEAMPIVKALGNDKLMPKHMEEIKVLVQKDFNVHDEEFTLKKLLELDINHFQEQIVSISNQATQEYKLRKELEELDAKWKEINFNIQVDASGEQVKLWEMEEIFTNLDESLAQINMILGSRFVKPLRKEAEDWKKNIVTLSDMVDEWLMCQRQVIYLRPIFLVSKDIQKILNEEYKRFLKIDGQFRALMKKVDKLRGCLKFVKTNGVVLDQLKNMNAILEDCNKKLEDYMNQKRAEFPRFFFLSNEELIDILANAADLNIIQLYLKVLFDALVAFEVVDEDKLNSLISGEKEMVPLKKKVTAQGGPEKWLRDLQDQMVVTLSGKMREGQTNYPNCELGNVKERINWIKDRKNPGQVIATVAQIQWCLEVENALGELSSGQNLLALSDLLTQNNQQIDDMINEVRDIKLGKIDRKIIVALITTDVHAKDIIEDLKKLKVSSDKDFQWQKQLRYYFDAETNESHNVNIQQVSAKLLYGYEYMGSTSRLVITPLTDKCWITISNALHINLGANPAGPAGTGKTESTKDLAKAIAIQCIVYNCSDQVDYIMMGKLFSGLCQQGCWTCLDEFNRILIEVLSVIAQQLLTITNGLKAHAEEIKLEDAIIPLRPEFGCHVTMNPGYAGRTELPDNLQVLFRPVAMMIPYYALISEIMLMAEGFNEARILSQKMVQLYQLSSQQLSQQKHYDFGLRAVKSVLNMAGSLKRASPEQDGDVVLIRAMRDANIPKFLKDDVLLFNAIVQDLFPKAVIMPNEYGELQNIIEQIITENNYQKTPNFVLKVLQLYETFNVRFGVMLVGQTGAGKTVCYNMLQQVMTYMREVKNSEDQEFQAVKKVVFNPKAISMGELYGYVDLDTQEWSDGLASKEMRNASMETGEDKTWVVFDGPVDALWIENMNTVLDDNMTLCLANGQRIKLRTQMRMLFEVENLEVASPATVSRCGMVYFTQEQLGWKPFVKTWLIKFFEDKDEEVITPAVKDQLDMLFEATVDDGLEYMRTHLPAEPITTTDLQLVTSMVNLIEYFLDENKGFKGNDEEKKKITEQIFAWCYSWGLGASLTTAGKDRFDSKIRDLFKAAQIPPSNTVFDYWYDLKSKEKTFKTWSSKVAPFEYDKDKSFFDLMVPTADTTRHSFVLEVLLDGQKPCFFTGESGVGKSAVIQNLIDRLKQDTLQPININMSAQTNSARTQSSIVDKLEKKKRTVLGALPGKKIAIFIDDINMPAPEEWGASPPIELLRLFIDRGGIFTRGDWEWRDVEDTTVIACSAPPGGGRNDLTMRFTRVFNMICLPQPSEGVLNEIFGQILENFLKTGFSDKVKNLKDAAITSTIEIYTRIQIEMRPTPDRFHYQFNLRDVSKVIQGLCMTKPVSILNDDQFMRLWVNEATRVFADRLINEGDRDLYKNIIQELLSKNFKMSPDIAELFEKLKFSDILKLDSPTQLYEYNADKGKLLKQLHGSLDEYNLTNSNKMHLVLFDDALEHLLKIARVLKQPRGHIMLIGVGGSGKQSLIRLCSFMRKMEMRQIEIFKGYSTRDFLDFMKTQMKEASIKQQAIAFVMTDTQIIDESFIENLNNLLNTGEIPNLMVEEDKDEIKNGIRPICQQRKILDDIDNIFNLFTTLVRENLHICLCMSPVGSILRVRCRQFPSLVNCCTLDYFSKWPEQALLYVSREFLKDLPDCSEQVKAGLSEMCMKIHVSVEDMSEEFYDSLRRRVYTTPKSYLDLISLYTKLLEIKREEKEKNKSRLAIGLKKLIDTNENIAELKDKIEEMVPKLKVKNEELSVIITKVTADKAVADEKEAKVSAEAEIVNKQASEAKVIADDAQTDLAKAAPIMKEAQNAVNDIDRNAIVDIQKMSAPSENIRFMMAGCMTLMGENADWKKGVQKALSNVNDFMFKLKNFDTEKVKEKTWKKVNDTYLKDPRFDPEESKKSSVAVSNICKWAHALYKYSIIVKDVAPKKAKYEEVSKVLKKAEAELKVKTDEVAEVKAKVAELESNMQKMLDEKEALEFEMDRSTKRMTRANKLVGLLADEGVRWKSTVEDIQEEIDRLVGDVFISCACISYYGAFTGDYRKRLVDTWLSGCLEREIPTSEDYTLVKTMGDPVVIRSWGIASLPSDPTSTENGILTTKAERYPLCIDPQQQANKWIKNMEKDNTPLILKFGGATFLREVTMAVRNGRPLMVEDVEEYVDPAMDPILMKQQFLGDGGMYQIRLGDATIDFDENFTFAMTSKMPNPHYLPEICIKVTLINFTVTSEGLEQQLLGDVVKAEKPEVEKKRDEVVLTMAKDAKTLQDLENNILKLLSEATIEQILDEDTLIEILEDSKEKSTQINQRMEQSKVVEVQINETRMQYISVAVRGSVLYFVISDLAGIDSMYQNSLAYVKQLFNKAIAESPAADTIEERLDILIDRITRILYTNISRGLFERDKLIYSFLIATSIEQKAGNIDMGIWNAFLRGPTVMSAEESAAKPTRPEDVKELLWDTLYSGEIRSTGTIDNVCQHIVDNWDEWSAWAQSDEPYDTKLPADYEEKGNNFSKLLLVRVLRSELTQQSVSLYVIRQMTEFFITPPATNMNILYQDLANFIPMIFVLSKGADPTASLLKFAAEMGIQNDKLLSISLGQGQGEKASRFIEQAKEDGSWVVLQNCHLAQSWMPTLEEKVLGFTDNKDTIHQDFRLFATSMPADYFPVAVLQNSLKLTTEPPRGLKANMTRCYANYSQDYLESCASKDKITVWRKLLFNLAFFHAIIQERRKFGPLGWNIRYEFNDSDLETSNIMLKGFLENQEEIPWDAILWITGMINYGGRVTDPQDTNCIATILERYLSLASLSDTYKYSPSGTYFCPPDTDIEGYRKYIQTLPLVDAPEIFGLHNNANITYQNNESLRLIDTVLSIQPRLATAAGGLTPDQIVLNKAAEFTEALPPLLDREESAKELWVLNSQGVIPSLSTVLVEEMTRFNILLTKMRSSLYDLDQAINGFQVMTEELDMMYLAIQNNKVPGNWTAISYLCLKPLSSWFKDMLQRVTFVDSWIKNGNPASYWMSGMFFPHGFLTGVKQSHARQHMIAIDQIDFSFDILEFEGPDEEYDRPEDGVFIYGLFSDGGRWDRETAILDEQFPGRLFDTMPMIHFKPIDTKAEEENAIKDDEVQIYKAPLYKAANREGKLSTTGQSTNYILDVHIPSNKPPSHWTHRAAALICMLSD